MDRNKMKNKLEELFVSYDIAKQLKELGFDEPCLAGFYHYISDKPERARQLLTPKDSIFGENYMLKNSLDFIKQPSIAINHHPICNENCSAPTIVNVIMWLYEKHDIWIYPTPTLNGNKDTIMWRITICPCGIKNQRSSNKNYLPAFNFDDNCFNSPTEAYLTGIEYVLNNLV